LMPKVVGKGGGGWQPAADGGRPLFAPGHHWGSPELTS
jgi:hypothetical protein